MLGWQASLVVLARAGKAARKAEKPGTYWRAERFIWGVDHVLRRMREPTHLCGAVLHQVRQADCSERSRSFSKGSGYRASRQSRRTVWYEYRRLRWARAAAFADCGNALDN
jgi:hypothetical protein